MFRKHSFLLPFLHFFVLSAVDGDVGSEAAAETGYDPSAGQPASEAPTTAGAAAVEVPVSDDPNIFFEKAAYHFRSETLEIKDEDGQVTDKVTKKRPSFHGYLPLLTMDGLLAALSAGGKEAELILEAVNNVIADQGRNLINDAIAAARAKGGDITLTQDVLAADKLTLTFIANIPKAERRGTGIAKEVWEAFEADYLEVMQQVHPDKKPEQIKKAAELLGSKFQKCKSNKVVIEALTSFLVQWYEATSNKEEFADVYSFLADKSATLMAADEAELLNAL